MARHVSPITLPGYRKGIPNPNKGKTYRAQILPHEDIIAMNEQCNTGFTGLRHRGMLGMLLGSGCRVGELCDLKVSDINLETRAVHIPGTKTVRADRWVGVNSACFAPVRDWLDVRREEGFPGPYAFCCISRNERGHQMRGAQVRQLVHHLARKAGLETEDNDRRIHPHAFRHTFASDLKREGVDIRVIQKALGHSNLAVTSIYLDHLDPSEVIDATANRILAVTF